MHLSFKPTARAVTAAALALTAVGALQGCSANSSSANPAESSPDFDGGRPLVLTSADLPPGYDIQTGAGSAQVAAAQRKNAAGRIEPADCAAVFSAQADRTERSHRDGIFANTDKAGAPEFYNVVIRDGESINDVRTVYAKCGTFSSETSDGRLVMQAQPLRVPAQIKSRESYVISTVSTITPAAGSQSNPVQTHMIGGYSQVGTRQVLFTSEVYGFGRTVDEQQFDELFVKAVQRASLQN